MPKVGVGQVSETYTMNSSKGNNALNKMPSTVSLSESEPCPNSMEELKARLSKAFVDTNIVIEGDKPFSIPEEEGFVYKSAFAIQKGNNLVMVAVNATDKDDMKDLTNLLHYCNHARFFLIFRGQSMNLYKVPYSVTAESSQTEENLFTFSIYK